MINKIIIVLVIFLSLEKVYGQGQTNNWYFGNQAGISFDGEGNINILTDGAINTIEGVATISDEQGNLLFYTDGASIYTRNHTVMPNGINLGSSSPSTQAALIVRLPNTDSIYYVFSLDVEGRSGGLQIAIVNLNLNNSLGQVISRNDTLEAQSTEKLTGVLHENGIDIWVLTHEINSDAFNAYLLTENGLNRMPVVSNVGITHQLELNGVGAIGYMRFSHDGIKLAITLWQGERVVEVFDFDNVTGEVANPIQFTGFTGGANNGPYGLEFSPNSQYLYVSESNLGTPQSRILQYDLTSSAPLNTETVIVTSDENFGTLLVAPDQKIYVAVNGASALSEISNPNLRGISSSFQANTVDLLTGRSGYGLPNFIRGFVTIVEYENICLGDTTIFFLESNTDIREAVWDFGDDSDPVTALMPGHIYAETNTYTVTVNITYTNGASQELTSDVIIDAVEATFLPIDTLCFGGSYTLNEGRPQGGVYEGQFVDSLLGLFQTDESGTGVFSVSYIYTNENGCADTASQVVVVVPVRDVNLIVFEIPPYCLYDDPETLNFVEPTGGIYSGPGIEDDTIFNPLAAGVDLHTITYTFIDVNGCETELDIGINVLEPISARLEAPERVCILSDTLQIARDTAVITGNFQGRGIVNSEIGLYFAMQAGLGNDTIVHTYSDTNNCVIFDTIFIEVLDTVPANFDDLEDVCLNGGTIGLNTGNPPGGRYVGIGITPNSNVFNPIVAGLGTHELMYILGNVEGCIDTAYQTITVLPFPDITNFPIPDFCTQDPPITLNYFSPLGGEYIFNSGVVTQIEPSTLSPGNYNLFYRYVDSVTDCSFTSGVPFSVFEATPLQVEQDTLFLCLSNNFVELTGANPNGGRFSGPGVVLDTLLNILQAGIGTHNLTYTFTNTAGCISEIDYIITIVDTPIVTFNPVPSVCFNGSPLDLSNFVSIEGGIFQGTGVTINLFTPALGGLGNHLIEYIYTSDDDCTVTVSEIINVLDATTLTVPNFGNLCIDSDSIFLFAGTPEGGIYSGFGYNPNSNYFNPRVSGIGNHTIRYTFTNVSSCVSSVDQTISVFQLPVVFLPETLESCSSVPITLNAFHPSHTDNTFYRWSNGDISSSTTIANVGINTISVEVFDTIGSIICSNFDTTIVQINPSPFFDIAENNIRACVPDSVILDAFHPSHIDAHIRYLWSSGDTTSRVVLKNVGNYTYTIAVEDTMTGCTTIDTLRVFINTKPIIDLGQDIVTCQNQAPVIIDARNTSHHPQTEYFWNTGERTSTIALDHLGLETVIVQVIEPLARCSSYDTIRVNISPSPVISLPDTLKICTRDLPFTLDAYHFTHTQNTIYSWSTGDKTSITNLFFEGSFNYFLNITDTLTGCFSEKNIFIQVLPLPVVDLGEDKAFCFDDGGLTLDASVTTSPNLSYRWNTGETTSSIEVKEIGNYIVRVTDRDTQCESSDSINVLIYPRLSVDLGPDKFVCLGSNKFQLDAFNNSHIGQNIFYQWSTAETTSVIESFIEENTQISISIFNPETSCIAFDTLNITFENIPFIDLSDTVLCARSTLVLNAFHESHSKESISYLWSTGETTSSIEISNINMSTTYTVRATNLERGCYNEDKAVVNFLPIPFLELGADTVLCQTNLRLNAYHISHQNDYHYLWNTGDTTSDIIVNDLGLNEYNVIIFRRGEANTCVFYDTIFIEMLEVPVTDLSIVNICEDDIPYRLSGRDESHSSQISYRWYDALGNVISSTDTFIIYFIGTYILEITDNRSGCIILDTFDVNIIETPFIDIIRFPNPTQTSLPARIGSSSTNIQSLNLKWSFEEGDTIFANSTNSLVIDVYRYGNYRLQVTNPITGCTSEDNFLLYSQSPSCIFPNAFTPNSDLKNDYFSPLTSDLKSIEIRIFDYENVEVFTKLLDVQEGDWQGTFVETWGWDGKNIKGIDLPEGKYFLKTNYSWINEFNEIDSRTEEGEVYLIR